MLRPLRTLLRLLVIARTLARRDALAPLEELGVAPGIVWLARLVSRGRAEGRPGQKLARALTELGPSFIKLGQFLSTRADLLGEEMAADLYELYSFKVLPALGAVVAGDRAAYQYLAESIRRFPAQDELAGMMEQAGLAQVRYRNLTGGIAALHSGWRV